jgi:hypothetical protein
MPKPLLIPAGFAVAMVVVGGASSAQPVSRLGFGDHRRHFQGQTQVDDCDPNGGNSIPNYAWSILLPTGQCPFPDPVFPRRSHLRALMPESRCGGNQYLCDSPVAPGSFSNRIDPTKTQKFGGMFQVDDCGVNTIGNRFNDNRLSCPPGFFQDWIGRVMAPESGCGANQFLCSARPEEAGGATFENGVNLGVNTLRYAGQYQVDDCGTNTIGPVGCARGYTSVAYGRVKGPEGGQCGVTQYVCVAVEPPITVTAGTYGGNCGAPHANVTQALTNACSSRAICDYTIDHRVIGDPVVGCPKDYVAEWTCPGTPAVMRSVRAAPEAGFGSTVKLECP